MRLAGVGVVVLGLSVVAVFALRGRPSGPELPEGMRVVDGSGFLGINEAVAIPGRVLAQKPPIATIEGHLAEDARATRELGATWVRSHSAVYPNLDYQTASKRQWTGHADRWVRTVQAEGLEALVMVSPWPGNQTSAHTDTYVVEDPEAYASWVSAVVERYDGDGVDDMPGLLRPIRHWEVDNEPDLKNTLQARGSKVDPTTFCTPEQYMAVLRVTADAIRAADPEATVLSGGIYRPHAHAGVTYLHKLDALGLLEVVDVVSLHTYFDGPGTETLERGLSAAPDGARVWLTETSVASRGDKRWMSQAWQAEMVHRVHAAALVHGVEKVFWHTLADAPVAPKHGISNHSLLRVTDAGFVDKPSAVAYRELAERLAEPLTIAEDGITTPTSQLVLESPAHWAPR